MSQKFILPPPIFIDQSLSNLPASRPPPLPQPVGASQQPVFQLTRQESPYNQPCHTIHRLSHPPASPSTINYSIQRAAKNIYYNRLSTQSPQFHRRLNVPRLAQTQSLSINSQGVARQNSIPLLTSPHRPTATLSKHICSPVSFSRSAAQQLNFIGTNSHNKSAQPKINHIYHGQKKVFQYKSSLGSNRETMQGKEQKYKGAEDLKYCHIPSHILSKEGDDKEHHAKDSRSDDAQLIGESAKESHKQADSMEIVSSLNPDERPNTPIESKRQSDPRGHVDECGNLSLKPDDEPLKETDSLHPSQNIKIEIYKGSSNRESATSKVPEQPEQTAPIQLLNYLQSDSPQTEDEQSKTDELSRAQLMIKEQAIEIKKLRNQIGLMKLRENELQAIIATNKKAQRGKDQQPSLTM